MFFSWKVALAQIQARFCNVIHSSYTGAEQVDALAELDHALVKWRDNIPLEFRPEQEMLVYRDVDAYRIVAVLHLEYYNILRALHWICITFRSNADDTFQNHPNHRIRSSEIIQLFAARSFIKVLNRYAYSIKSHRILIHA